MPKVVWIVALALSGLTLACTACGPAAPTCTADGVDVDIVDNHRTSGGDHKLEISADDVVAGVAQTYDIRGDNTGHTHTVTVSADNFADLQEGISVSLESSDTGAAGNDHTHDIVLSCPAA